MTKSLSITFMTTLFLLGAPAAFAGPGDGRTPVALGTSTVGAHYRGDTDRSVEIMQERGMVNAVAQARLTNIGVPVDLNLDASGRRIRYVPGMFDRAEVMAIQPSLY